MDFVSNQELQRKECLEAIGVKNVEELFSVIPEELKLERLAVDDGISEYEGMRFMEELASKNTYQQFDNYLGGGCYEHHQPAIVSSICSKSEFLTSYTPYQAEASQGVLQALFEYQSAICTLTQMDVSNASLYDGASACAEGLLMAIRAKKNRDKVLIAKNLNPHYRGVVEQYLKNQAMMDIIPFDKEGRLQLDALQSQIDASTAAILLQSPNFFGGIEEAKTIVEIAKSFGALVVLVANPLSYGLFTPAGDLGADIAVGDLQPFGLPMQFGGPSVGYMACRQDLVRQLPGRIVGETTDSKGRKGYVLTLQAREQHIRREKATSNICTNQTLAALGSLVAILWYGKRGLCELARTNYQRTTYLSHHLQEMPHIKLLSSKSNFNEFALHFGQPKEFVKERFREARIEPGIDLEPYFPELKEYFLVAVTETKSKGQLDRYLRVANQVLNGNSV